MSPLPLGILALSGAGAAGAYDLLETKIINSSVSSIEFTGLGAYSNYKHLQMRCSIAVQENIHIIGIRLNGASLSTNYRSHQLFSDGSGVLADNSNTNYIEVRQSVPRLVTPGSGADYSFNGMITDFLDFSNTSKNTTVRSLYGFHEAASLGQGVGITSGVYLNTSAITSISYVTAMGGLFTLGSRFSLYGVK